MPSYVWRVDRFTTLDDLPRKLHGDREAVRAALLKAGRFSVFDVTTRAIGHTLTKLEADLSLVFDKTVGYPWTLVREAPPPSEYREGGGVTYERLARLARGEAA